MLLTALSDTHVQHRDVVIQPCDILLHSGDLTHNGELPNVYDFINWLNEQPATYKVFIAGNHDRSFQDERKNKILAYLKQFDNIHYLQDDFVEIEGLKIYGTPWQPWFYNWAFNVMSEYERAEIWDKIPNDTDILLVHGPPYCMGDKVPDGSHVGCKALRKRLHELKCKLVVYGHIHEGRGIYRTDNSLCLNATVLDGQYNLAHDPYLVEINGFGEASLINT